VHSTAVAFPKNQKESRQKVRGLVDVGMMDW
jgi:hypothetical protein